MEHVSLHFRSTTYNFDVIIWPFQCLTSKCREDHQGIHYRVVVTSMSYFSEGFLHHHKVEDVSTRPLGSRVSGRTPVINVFVTWYL